MYLDTVNNLYPGFPVTPCVAGLLPDAKTGDAAPIGVLDNTGVKPFATPAGWEDAVLVLEGSR